MPIFDERSSEVSRPATEAGSPPTFEFLAAERRNRLIGMWAAEKMGLTGDSKENYARAIGKGHADASSEEDVIRRVLGDLVASNIVVREAEVRVKAAEFLAQSRESLKAGA
ncbi:MAG TPA: DUF1476 domain-containing protein [Asticcacaulis sp.]|nr:DUF1476 domain-containing protein [Asticcacaulis sp.]